MQRNNSRSTGVQKEGAKTVDQQGVVGASSREKTLRINKKKTQVFRINSKCKNRILIDDQELKEVDKYNYLGANVIKQGGGGDDIVNRIRKARVFFMKLK